MRDFSYLKSAASDLRKLLAEHNVDVGHTVALNLIVAVVGFKNWHAFSAASESDGFAVRALPNGIARLSQRITSEYDLSLSASCLSQFIDFEWADPDSSILSSYQDLPLMKDILLSLDICEGYTPNVDGILEFEGPTTLQQIFQQTARACEIRELHRISKLLGLSNVLVARTSDMSHVYGMGDALILEENGTLIFALHDRRGPSRDRINDIRQEFFDLAIASIAPGCQVGWQYFFAYAAAKRFIYLNAQIPQHFIDQHEIYGAISDYWGIGLKASVDEMREMTEKLLALCVGWHYVPGLMMVFGHWVQGHCFATMSELIDAIENSAELRSILCPKAVGL